jgi:MFS transporter, PHS family, inorganic phosphate transporter
MVAVLVVYGINAGYKSTTRQGLIFILFSLFMALGAICSWAYLPDVQRRVLGRETGKPLGLVNKNLEELGEGRERAKRNGEVVTIREKLHELKRRRLRLPLGPSSGEQEAQRQDIGMR